MRLLELGGAACTLSLSLFLSLLSLLVTYVYNLYIIDRYICKNDLHLIGKKEIIDGPSL